RWKCFNNIDRSIRKSREGDGVMKKYKCIKKLILQKYDDDGFVMDNEFFFTKEGSVWELDESDSKLIGGEIRLITTKEGYLDWLEIDKETLEEHFEEIN
ncbi:hypothetical protein, partial [Anaerophilus nitritogenes]|uniref:hypothetical protein n=1 Tax=Anaerophilus nitritogenes TaxID=2498136 RepID=UPI00311AA03A